MMQAGRELDALIAEKVMGCHPDYLDRNKTILICTCGEIPIDRPHNVKHPIYSSAERLMVQELRHYSTDISAAWEVVDKLEVANPYNVLEDDNLPPLRINAVIRMDDGKWMARFDGSAEYEDYYERSTYNRKDSDFVIEDTAQLAICHAALKAVEAWA